MDAATGGADIEPAKWGYLLVLGLTAASVFGLGALYDTMAGSIVGSPEPADSGSGNPVPPGGEGVT